MEEFIEVEDRGPIRILAINRPEVRNALNTSVLLQMRRAVRQAAETNDLRALVVTGRGGAFSGGADVKEWLDKKNGIDPHPDHDWVEEAVKLVHDIFTFPKPSVAMIDGPIVGAGLDMALACDFRVSSERARFICAYTRVGYPPDCGGSWLMPRLIGVEAAKMFAYTGDAWDAAKALSAGMVTEVVPQVELETRAFALAEKLASGPTVAIGQAKHLIDSAFSRSLAEQQHAELQAGRICGTTQDHAEGLLAANERRTPRFIGR